MAGSPERQAKRQRLHYQPDDISGDSLISEWFSRTGTDDTSPVYDEDSTFLEAMECTELLAASPRTTDNNTTWGADEGRYNNDMLWLDAPVFEESNLQHNASGDIAFEGGTGSIQAAEECDSDIVCFGTIPSVHGRCAQPKASLSRFPVTITSSGKFQATDNENLCGIIPPQYGTMMQSLLDEHTLKLFAFCSIDTDILQKHTSGSHSQVSCSLEVTVYGPKKLFDEIGEWFQTYNVYLQDPRTCDMDVKYWNPHRLSSNEFNSCPFVSQIVLLGSGEITFEEIEEQLDYLDVISGQDELEETAEPKLIKASLHRHQKQALTFMLRREKGWALETKSADVWEVLDSSNDRKFFNRISNTHQSKEPPPFYGGIVADPMGLGKTLTMIALAATDLELGSALNTEYDFIDDPEHTKPSVSATLVIVPQPPHLIRNMKTRMARAICDLESASRWAVTGTPIQNHLSDLSALLQFIRAYPYDDAKKFDMDISHLWKSGKEQEAGKRLKRLSRCLILRRAKRTITLPSRHDLRSPAEFTKAERTLYDNIRNQTMNKIEDALGHGTDLSQRSLYVNILQQIESMRLVCNLGLHYSTRHAKMKTGDMKNWAQNAQEAFNIQREMDTISCSQCLSSLDVTESMGSENTHEDSAQFFECLKYACGECSYKNRISNQRMTCGHIPSCQMAPISVSNSSIEEVFSGISGGSNLIQGPSSFPCKVKALISDLKKQPEGVKCIVFSTCKLTLNIVEAALQEAQMRSVRFDGNVSQIQRQPVLNEFKTNPDVRVILLTLQCGAVGLTLTEASRAYLMEPHWNPTIEEQALARIHRIGQEREVTTVRFYVRDSFEERVMELQESKKNLASVLLSGHDGGKADNSIGALQRLRSLL
ncbi:hypothetical protein ACEQ8H_001368 [Pleosporales sp. CAS-2024a]